MSCSLSSFPLRLRNDSGFDTVEVTVYNYYVKRGIKLEDSVNFPCLNVGKTKRPIYIPIEVSQNLLNV
jgi:eukaryotic translation initiation factor 2C